MTDIIQPPPWWDHVSRLGQDVARLHTTDEHLRRSQDDVRSEMRDFRVSIESKINMGLGGLRAELLGEIDKLRKEDREHFQLIENSVKDNCAGITRLGEMLREQQRHDMELRKGDSRRFVASIGLATMIFILSLWAALNPEDAGRVGEAAAGAALDAAAAGM